MPTLPIPRSLFLPCVAAVLSTNLARYHENAYCAIPVSALAEATAASFYRQTYDSTDLMSARRHGGRHRPPLPLSFLPPPPVVLLMAVQPDMFVPTESTIAQTRDRLDGSGSDKSDWATSFGYQMKVLLQRQSKQSRGEVRTSVSMTAGVLPFLTTTSFTVLLPHGRVGPYLVQT